MSSFELENIQSLRASPRWATKPSHMPIWLVRGEFRYAGWWQNLAKDASQSIIVQIEIGPHTLARNSVRLPKCADHSRDVSDPATATGYAWHAEEVDVGLQGGIQFIFDTGSTHTMLFGELAAKFYAQLDRKLVVQQSLVLADNRLVTCPTGPIAVRIFGVWIQVPCCFLLPNGEHRDWWRSFLRLGGRKTQEPRDENPSHLLGMTDLLPLLLFCAHSTGVDVFRRNVIKAPWGWADLHR